MALHVAGDFVTQVNQAVGWAYWEVTTFVLNLVTEVEAVVVAAGPVSFNAVDFVERATSVAVEAQAVKDEEFWLWAEESGVTNTEAVQVSKSLLGDRTWAAVVEFAGAWLENVTDQAQSGHAHGRDRCRQCLGLA